VVLPKRGFCEWVSDTNKAPKSWCFELRDRVVISDDPVDYSVPEALIVEAVDLIGYSL
jgi:hypothetical protein